MLDFKIYKPVRSDAMEQAGVINEQEFAVFFAGMISKAAGCSVAGEYRDDECVHLLVDEQYQSRVAYSLDRRGLSHMMSYI